MQNICMLNYRVSYPFPSLVLFGSPPQHDLRNVTVHQKKKKKQQHPTTTGSGTKEFNYYYYSEVKSGGPEKLG